jgi:hypothetical protein
MDTSLPQNALLIERIKHKALGSGLFEAFLESAPQLILQCSIILRTGNTSNFILQNGVFLKLFKLAYYIRKVKHQKILKNCSADHTKENFYL